MYITLRNWRSRIKYPAEIFQNVLQKSYQQALYKSNFSFELQRLISQVINRQFYRKKNVKSPLRDRPAPNWKPQLNSRFLDMASARNREITARYLGGIPIMNGLGFCFWLQDSPAHSKIFPFSARILTLERDKRWPMQAIRSKHHFQKT